MPLQDPDEERRLSFGSVAEAYDAARPGYPPAAVDWLLDGVPSTDIVVDLGAGTGLLSFVVARRGHPVVAVEPSAPMRARLEARAAAEPHLPVTGADGSAEHIPLAVGSVGAVTVAQAFHWFDPPAALAEIARVLRPGGRLGVIYNNRDESTPATARLGELLGREDAAGWNAFPATIAAVEADGRWGPIEQVRQHQEHLLDRAGLRDLVRSRSRTATMNDADRAELLAAVDAVFDEAAGADGRWALPYHVDVLRTSLRPLPG